MTSSTNWHGIGDISAVPCYYSSQIKQNEQSGLCVSQLVSERQNNSKFTTLEQLN